MLLWWQTVVLLANWLLPHYILHTDSFYQVSTKSEIKNLYLKYLLCFFREQFIVSDWPENRQMESMSSKSKKSEWLGKYRVGSLKLTDTTVEFLRLLISAYKGSPKSEQLCPTNKWKELLSNRHHFSFYQVGHNFLSKKITLCFFRDTFMVSDRDEILQVESMSGTP